MRTAKLIQAIMKISYERYVVSMKLSAAGRSREEQTSHFEIPVLSKNVLALVSLRRA